LAAKEGACSRSLAGPLSFWSGVRPYKVERPAGKCPSPPIFFFLITHDCTQVQILHEYDTCCFSPHDRHDGTLRRGRCLPFCAVFCGRLQKNIANNGFFNNNANNEFLMQLYI
jgi:hypothetical protein